MCERDSEAGRWITGLIEHVSGFKMAVCLQVCREGIMTSRYTDWRKQLNASDLNSQNADLFYISE